MRLYEAPSEAIEVRRPAKTLLAMDGRVMPNMWLEEAVEMSTAL